MAPRNSTRTNGPRSNHERPTTGRHANRRAASPPPNTIAHRAVRALMNDPFSRIIHIEHLNNVACPFLETDAGENTVLIHDGIDNFETAGDLNLLDRVEHNNFNDRVGQSNHVAKVIHLMNGRLSMDFFREYLQLPNNEDDGHAMKAQLENLRKLGLDWQRATGRFIMQGVVRTRALYRRHALDVSTYDERVLIWKKIFGRAPFEVTKRMIGQRYAAVNLEQVFGFPAATEPRRNTWRKLFRLLFVMSCEKAFSLTYGHYDANPSTFNVSKVRRFYAAWRAIPMTPRFREADPDRLWKVENCPARTRIDTGRAEAPMWEPGVDDERGGDLSDDDIMDGWDP